MSKNITSLEINGNKLDISLKADTDLSNVTTSAKKTISSQSLPSSRYYNFQINASGSKYTMPDDGWLYVSCNMTGNTSGYVHISNNTRHYENQAPIIGNTANANIIVPVNKNDELTISYVFGTIACIRFIYANATA